MLSKEEIEKAKKMLNNPKKEDLIEIIRIFKRNGIENYCITKNETIETLLQYIQELEVSNKELDKENNRLEKIEIERDKANKIIDLMAEYLAKVRDCPNEDKGVNLDCENRCSNEDSIYAECWKLYFEKKVEEE